MSIVAAVIMAFALNVTTDSIWKRELASDVLDCVRSVVVPKTAPNVSLEYRNLIKNKINVNV